jgi:hypothetical protein
MTNRVKGVYEDIVKRVTANEDGFVFTSLGRDRYGKEYPILDLGYERIPNESFATKRSYWTDELQEIYPGFDQYEAEQFFFAAGRSDDLIGKTNPFNLSTDFPDFVGFKRGEGIEFFAERMVLTSLAVHRGVALPMIAAFHDTSETEPKPKVSTLIFRSPELNLQEVVEKAIHGQVSEPAQETMIRTQQYMKIAYAMTSLLERLRDEGFWLTAGWDIEKIQAVSTSYYGVDTFELYLFDFNPVTARVWNGFKSGDCGILLHAMLLITELYLSFGGAAQGLVKYFTFHLKQQGYENSCVGALEELNNVLFVSEDSFDRAKFIHTVTRIVKNRVSVVFANNRALRKYNLTDENDILKDLSDFVTNNLKIGDTTNYYKRQKDA